MAKILEQILGHEKQKESLIRAYRQSKLYPSLLFAGPSGIGKKSLALGFAQALLCKHDELACGQCPSCLRIENLESEDLLFIEPDGQSIKVEQTKEIHKFLGLARLHEARVVLIDACEKMNPQAANSLLKVLEEPPPSSYFFLITHNLANILPTIRSRSQLIALQALPNEILRALSDAPDWQIRAARGSMDQLQYWQDNDKQELRKDCIEFLQSIPKGSSWEAFQRIKEMATDRQRSLELFSLIQYWFRDLSILKSSPDDLLFSDQKDELEKWQNQSQVEILKLAQLSIAMEQNLLQNVDKSLVFENFWLESAKICKNPNLG